MLNNNKAITTFILFHQPVDMLLLDSKTCPLLIFHQSVDMMLSPMFRGGHFKDIGHAEKCLLGVSVGDNLEDCKVF